MTKQRMTELFTRHTGISITQIYTFGKNQIKQLLIKIVHAESA